jgi:hypothetical protein
VSCSLLLIICYPKISHFVLLALYKIEVVVIDIIACIFELHALVSSTVHYLRSWVLQLVDGDVKSGFIVYMNSPARTVTVIRHPYYVAPAHGAYLRLHEPLP